MNKTQHGGYREGAGRPKSLQPRCPCDQMTLRRCLSRRGKCLQKQLLTVSPACGIAENWESYRP